MLTVVAAVVAAASLSLVLSGQFYSSQGKWRKIVCTTQLFDRQTCQSVGGEATNHFTCRPLCLLYDSQMLA